MKIKLRDGTWLEGKCDMPTINGATGIWLKEVFASTIDREGVRGTIPLAKEVFVPISGVVFIVTEE